MILRNGSIAFSETLLFASDISGFRSQFNSFQNSWQRYVDLQVSVSAVLQRKKWVPNTYVFNCARVFRSRIHFRPCFTAGDSMFILHCCDIAICRKRFGIEKRVRVPFVSLSCPFRVPFVSLSTISLCRSMFYLTSKNDRKVNTNSVFSSFAITQEKIP